MNAYFRTPSELPYELPDFAVIDEADLVDAFREGLAEHAREIEAIAGNTDEPTWENTIEALEVSGQMLQRVAAIIFNYAGTDATATICEIEATVSPELAAHNSAMLLNRELYQRIEALAEGTYDGEEAAVLEYWCRRFRRGGAALGEAERAELREIDSRLATLSTRFGTGLLESTNAAAVLLTEEAETAGLSEADKAYYRAAAEAADNDGWLIHLGLPSVQPVLENLADAGARAKVHAASLGRGQEGNGELLVEIASLRARRAALLGYDTHADFIAEAETAGSHEAVEELLHQVTAPAVANAHGELKQAKDLCSIRGEDGEFTGADWPYWSAQLRAEELAVDEGELKKYFPLEQVMVDGAFYAAKRLYNISLAERDDLRGYHEDVRVWEVTDDTTGEGIGLLLTDMYARETKRGGAWMSSFVDQSNLIGQAPVVVNVMNIAKPAGYDQGEQALLTLDEVHTVFHEFGHALHGLLSDVRYPSLSGTNVPRDFVEFPSQINENWALEPEVLSNYARHVDTGEALPEDMVAAVQAQAKWGQGFATTEYLGACWVDLAWHSLTEDQAAALTAADVEKFEAEALENAGIDLGETLAPRYRSTYFNHIFAGGYSAGYWSYLWAEVLDADGFQAFVDTGAAGGNTDPDDVRAAGDRFRRMILSRGATIDYKDAFWMFRGQQCSVEPLLRRRGLAAG